MPAKRKISHQLHKALREIRLARNMSQSDFQLAASQEYVSRLEHEVQVPTLSKIDDLAHALSVHPLALLTQSYLKKRDISSLRLLLEQVEEELTSLQVVGLPAAPKTERKG